MDVKSVFLHEDLIEEIYMEQPLDFEKDVNLVCQLKKSLYGFKQAPRAWYEKIDCFFIDLGFKCCESNNSIYVLHTKDEILIVALYVNDLVIIGSNVDLILGLKKQLANTFEMTDPGLLHFFLGIQILQIDDGIFISQRKYVIDLLQRFKMEDCKPYATPLQSGIKLTKE